MKITDVTLKCHCGSSRRHCYKQPGRADIDLLWKSIRLLNHAQGLTSHK